MKRLNENQIKDLKKWDLEYLHEHLEEIGYFRIDDLNNKELEALLEFEWTDRVEKVGGAILIRNC